MRAEKGVGTEGKLRSRTNLNIREIVNGGYRREGGDEVLNAYLGVMEQDRLAVHRDVPLVANVEFIHDVAGHDGCELGESVLVRFLGRNGIARNRNSRFEGVYSRKVGVDRIGLVNVTP